MGDFWTDEEYVPLNRYLWDNAEAMPSAMERRYRDIGLGRAAKTWSDYLLPSPSAVQSDALVLVAASNSGKSMELRHQAASGARGGYFAFYSKAVALAKSSLRDALSGPDQRRFDDWNRTSKPASFFVDAVDEVRLGEHSFEDVALHLSQAIDFSTRDVQLILSVRTGSWSSDDLKRLRQLLRKGKDAVIKELTLEPLSIDQIGLLAKADGVQDVAAFCAAFREDEFDDLLDLHPMHARVFIRHWKEHGQFGTWTKMLEESVEFNVHEQNANRQKVSVLSPETMRDALRRMAAAGLLTRKPYVTLSPGNAVPEAVDAGELFDDWPSNRLHELFARSFLFHKGESAMQLPQGALNLFLAAAWFADRVRRGWEPAELADQLAIAAFQDGELEVPASLGPLAGWIASAVPDMREHLIAVQPRILLYEGDPSQLSPRDCEQALRRLCALIEQGKLEPSPSRATLRKLATPALSLVVLELLRSHRGSRRVERHLIDYVELGRYQECVDHLLSIATDPTSNMDTRILAVRAVGRMGVTERERLLILLADPDDGLRDALVEALVPDQLHGPAAVHAILRLRGDELRYTLRSIAANMAAADIDATLDAVRPLLQTSLVNADTVAYRDICVTFLIERLVRVGTVAPAWFIDLLLTLEDHLQHHTEAGVGRRKLRECLRTTPELRRGLWTARIARAALDGSGLGYDGYRLDATELEDLPWLLARADELDPGSRLERDLRYEIEAVIARASAEERSRWARSGGLGAHLTTRLEEFDQSARARDREVAAKAARERDEVDAQRAKNIAALQPLRDSIAKGERLDALDWAWNLTKTDQAWGRVDVGKLHELVGQDLVAVFQAGFKAFWRRQQVPLPSPGGTSAVVVIGLSGLTIEFRDGLEAASLRHEEAVLAARYALHELNSLPPWLDDLVAAHRDAVVDVLSEAVTAEWQDMALGGRLIGRAATSSPLVASVIGNRIMELAESVPPPDALRRLAGDAILASTVPSGRIVSAIKGWLTTDTEEDALCIAHYIRLWAHVEPLGAATWIREVEAREPAQAASIVIETAGLMEDDFRFGELKEKSTFLSMAGLAVWLPILFGLIKPADDLEREGTYVPTSRDEAQRFRQRCLRVVETDPSRQARSVLIGMRSLDVLSDRHDWWESIIEHQLSVAAEAAAPAWQARDVLALERGDERRPTSVADLHRILVRHLARVARLLENDDFGYASLIREDAVERDFQLWTASNLKLVSGHLYTVVRENAVQGEKEVDISAFADGIGAVPVEIKPAAGKSFEELKAAIHGQLFSRYMQPPDVTHGILLVINNQEQQWRLGAGLADFSALLAALRDFAREFGHERGKIITVEAIDVVAARRRGQSPKLRTRQSRGIAKAAD